MVKRIPLTRGYFAIVDDEDYAFLSKMKWHCTSAGYAVRQQYVPKSSKLIYMAMHRIIMKAPRHRHVDHINCNPLDNRRCNLRLATLSQNQWNRKAIKGKRFKGIRKSHNKWEARISRYKKRYTLGSYATPEEAALAYNKEAIRIYGEFANLNIL